jgi:phenylacetate-CoA ligase
MAASMPDDDRYFFWPQYGHFELVNIAGEAVTRPGEFGEIVGTSFDNSVMPFIRYRTGDFAVLSDTPHPALPGYPVCERIEGRLQEFLVCRDQRLISITTMGAAHFEKMAEVQELQYEQHQPGLVTLKVVSARPLNGDLVAEITRTVSEKTQGGCDVLVKRVERIERTGRGKHRMLIQHIDLGPCFCAGRVK